MGLEYPFKYNKNGAKICRNMKMTEKYKHLREAIVLQKTKRATKMGRMEIINGKIVKLNISVRLKLTANAFVIINKIS